MIRCCIADGRGGRAWEVETFHSKVSEARVTVPLSHPQPQKFPTQIIMTIVMNMFILFSYYLYSHVYDYEHGYAYNKLLLKKFYWL
jgi:hypothetical protein